MTIVGMVGRLPLQGGLPPTGAVAGAVVEIACDESGFSGTNLLHSNCPVITHASVDLDKDEAVALVSALRSEFRFSPHEVKSGRFLRRPDAGAAVQWLMEALRDRAYVHRIDKEFFLVNRVVDLLLSEPSYATVLSAEDDAATLYQAKASARDEWHAFLTAFADLVRMKRRQPARVERFFLARDALARRLAGAPAQAVLEEITVSRVRAVLTRLEDEDRSIPPPLEPMLPALAETILHWSGGQRRVLVFHDEQSALTADRLTRLNQALPGSPLAGLVMVDSRDDPRVQVADLLAGTARRFPAFVRPARRAR